MMRFALVAMVIAGTWASGENYLIERRIMGSADETKGAVIISNSTRLNVVRTNENSMMIQFVPAVPEVKIGDKVLIFSQPLVSQDAQVQKAPSDINVTSVLLNARGIKVYSSNEVIAEGEYWGEVERVLYDKLQSRKIVFPSVAPIIEHIAKIPFLMKVALDIKPDDTVDVPYVSPRPKSQVASTEEGPSQMKCIKRDGHLVEFTSHYNTKVGHSVVTTDVLLKYDLDRQTTISVKLDRVTRMKDSRSERVHAGRETWRFYPKHRNQS